MAMTKGQLKRYKRVRAANRLARQHPESMNAMAKHKRQLTVVMAEPVPAAVQEAYRLGLKSPPRGPWLDLYGE